MNSLFRRISIFTWMHILESNEKCIVLLEGLDLIPKKTDPAPECPACSCPMNVNVKKCYTLGWGWACSKRSGNRPRCYRTINPLRGTFFENSKMPLKDTIALMFAYLIKMRHNDIKEHMICWRRCRNDTRQHISTVTIRDFYSRFDDVILFALNKESKTLRMNRSIREKLISKYAKIKNVKPTFQNLLFQFLMDIKLKYPCFKIFRKEDTSASDSETSNKDVSNSTAPPCSISVSSNGLTKDAVTTNSNMSGCTSTSITAKGNLDQNNHNREITGVVKFNTSVSTDLLTSSPNITVLNDNATCNTSSCVSSDSLTSHSDTENVESINGTPASFNDKALSVSYCSNTAVKDAAFVKKKGNFDFKNVMNSNASTSSDISFPDNVLLNKNSISNYPSMYNIIDGVKYNHDLFMEIDHIETVITIDDQHIDNDSL